MALSQIVGSEALESAVQIEARADGGVTVTLQGDLGLGWFGRLSTALARRGVSIVAAQATRTADGNWTGRLELSSADDVQIRELDYLGLSQEVAFADVAAPVLDRYRVERTESGALKLRIVATDRVGLLAGLLDRLELLGLFPERFVVTTTGRTVDDTLWLRGVGGYSPSLQVEVALRDVLLRVTRPTEHAGP